VIFEKKYDVYFAAPLSREEDAQRNAEYARELRNAGLTVFLPQEIGRVVDETVDKNKMRSEYFNADLEALVASRTLLMFLGREPSAGACWEMGYAHAKHIPIVGYNLAGIELGTFLSQSTWWLDTFKDVIDYIRTYLDE
jgi:nucleoside 2-deoxyribosyltransferase